ncbi:MAG: hypothetical protein QM783_05090 [Phycisphaerales bacterium]
MLDKTEAEYCARLIGFAAVDIFVRKGASALVNWADSSRLTPEQVSRAANDYPGEFAYPTDVVFQKTNTVMTESDGVVEFVVNVPFWSSKERLSDLEIVLIVRHKDKSVEIILWDIDVP